MIREHAKNGQNLKDQNAQVIKKQKRVSNLDTRFCF